MKKQVLFVDDEPNILQGLQRTLRPLRHEWEMTFAASGDEALCQLEETACDVVVSDMRMPKMDGLALMEQVRERHPETIRIILSGQADRDANIAAIGPAHQYLSKPCDSETLKASVERACGLRMLISGEAVAALAARVGTLPSVPEVYLAVKQELANPDASAETVADILARDAAMTAKILQVVNSAFFGLRQEVVSPIEAVRLMGFELVQTLVLSSGVFARVADKALAPLTEDLWRHSLLTASVAKTIARAERADAPTVDQIVTTALLHDVGKLVLASALGAEYLQLLREAAARPESLCAIEAEAFGATHAEVGAYLLALWALPFPMAEIIAYHHRPAAVPVAGFSPLVAVHVANALAHALADGDDGLATDHVDCDYLDACGLRDRYDVWTKACRDIEAPA